MESTRFRLQPQDGAGHFRFARAEADAATVAVKPGHEREDGGIGEAEGTHRAGVIVQARKFRHNSTEGGSQAPKP